MKKLREALRTVALTMLAPILLPVSLLWGPGRQRKRRDTGAWFGLVPFRYITREEAAEMWPPARAESHAPKPHGTDQQEQGA